MAAPSASRRWASIAGWMLAGASALFLLMIARERRADIASIDLSGREWVTVALLAMAYGASLFLLAGAWHCLLSALDIAPDDARVSIRSFTTSQVAKYVPGNVFHYVGRHMILRKESLPHGRLIVASVLEVGLMLVAAGLVVSGVLVTARPQLDINAWTDTALWLGIAFGLLAPVAVALVVVVLRRSGAVKPWWILAAFGNYLVFFAVMGLIFSGALDLVGEAPTLLAAGSGVTGWMAGFVTPGAPAGVGTREAALVLIGSPMVSQEVVLVAALLFRVITLAGDVLCFTAGRLIPTKRVAQPS